MLCQLIGNNPPHPHPPTPTPRCPVSQTAQMTTTTSLMDKAAKVIGRRMLPPPLPLPRPLVVVVVVPGVRGAERTAPPTFAFPFFQTPNAAAAGFVCLFVCLSVCLSVCVSVCVSAAASDWRERERSCIIFSSWNPTGFVSFKGKTKKKPQESILWEVKFVKL